MHLAKLTRIVGLAYNLALPIAEAVYPWREVGDYKNKERSTYFFREQAQKHCKSPGCGA